MSVNLESLEFEIQSNSTVAVQGIDALTSSLTRLKNATSGGLTGLSKTNNQLKRLGDTISGIHSENYFIKRQYSHLSFNTEEDHCHR